MSDNLDKLREETEAKKLKFQSNLYSTVNSVYEVKNKVKDDWNNYGVTRKTYVLIKYIAIAALVIFIFIAIGAFYEEVIRNKY